MARLHIISGKYVFHTLIGVRYISNCFHRTESPLNRKQGLVTSERAPCFYGGRRDVFTYKQAAMLTRKGSHNAVRHQFYNVILENMTKYNYSDVSRMPYSQLQICSYPKATRSVYCSVKMYIGNRVTNTSCCDQIYIGASLNSKQNL